MADVRRLDDRRPRRGSRSRACGSSGPTREALLRAGGVSVRDWLYAVAWRHGRLGAGARWLELTATGWSRRPSPRRSARASRRRSRAAPAACVRRSTGSSTRCATRTCACRSPSSADAHAVGVSSVTPRRAARCRGAARRLLDRLLAGARRRRLLAARTGTAGWCCAPPAARTPRAGWARCSRRIPTAGRSWRSPGAAAASSPRARRAPSTRCELLFPGGSTETRRADVPASPVRPLLQLAGRRGRRRGRAHGSPPAAASACWRSAPARVGRRRYVLPRAARRPDEYVFTDVSPLFRRGRREQFAAWPFVRTGPSTSSATPTTGLRGARLRHRGRRQRAARHGRPPPHVRHVAADCSPPVACSCSSR